MGSVSYLDLTEHALLLKRLKAANPRRYEQVVAVLRDLVESQELLAGVPAVLRTQEQFRAKRYLA